MNNVAPDPRATPPNRSTTSPSTTNPNPAPRCPCTAGRARSVGNPNSSNPANRSRHHPNSPTNHSPDNRSRCHTAKSAYCTTNRANTRPSPPPPPTNPHTPPPTPAKTPPSTTHPPPHDEHPAARRSRLVEPQQLGAQQWSGGQVVRRALLDLERDPHASRSRSARGRWRRSTRPNDPHLGQHHLHGSSPTTRNTVRNTS